MSSGVPSNADIVILSITASFARGASAGASSNPGVPREYQRARLGRARFMLRSLGLTQLKTPASSVGIE
jgi:hypothetical protein